MDPLENKEAPVRWQGGRGLHIERQVIRKMSITQTDSTCKLEDYINLEWKLIPCCAPASKGRGCRQHGESCPSPGKRPLVRGWRKPPSPGQVKSWAKRWPDANWALLTGEPSGVVVLDVDDEEAEMPGGIQLTPLSLTGRGRHYFLRYDRAVARSVSVGSAMELKANGSYVVLPESLHPTGTTYTWAVSPWELDGELAPVPEWLERRLREKPKIHKRPIAEVVRGVREGERNVQATRIAGKLLGALPPSDWESVAWPLLVGWNRLNKPPLQLSELRRVFDKIAERELLKALKAPRAPELQRRIHKLLTEQPHLTDRDLRRKLHGYRYGRTFDLVLHYTRRAPYPLKRG